MPHPVYLLSELGAPRNHHAIFVETNADSSGYMYQVTGNIQTGMAFGHRETEKPEDSPLFIEKSPIGTAAEGDYEKIREIVETIAPPGKQFDGPRRLDEKVPIRRCQEWT
ncbi:hypothetical protein DM02DRAFT_500692, partial [Periconia macrospinosa]